MPKPRSADLRVPLTVLLFLLLGATIGPSSASAVPGKKGHPVYVPSGQWEAYFVDSKGRAYPLRQPLEANDDKDWMHLRFTDYDGPRTLLAVIPVENKSASVEQAANSGAYVETDQASEVPVAAISELLTTALFATHRFDLVERKALEAVLSEQDLNASGRVAKPTAAIGRALGADYLIFASVNEWTPNKSSIGGFGGKTLKLVGARKQKAEVAMSFRVVDSTTGQVLFAQTDRATAGSWAFTLGGARHGAGGAGGFQKSSPISYAVEACINKAVYQLAQWLGNRPWSGSVVKVDNSKIYINAGSNKGLETGMMLEAISLGDELIDPDTGMSLGSESREIGTLKVTTVHERFSVATVVQGCTGLKKGDQVKLSQP